jgi:hypothetical protein
MALVYKARLDRPKDQADLAATLPLLSSRQRAWLADMIAHLHPATPGSPTSDRHRCTRHGSCAPPSQQRQLSARRGGLTARLDT